MPGVSTARVWLVLGLAAAFCGGCGLKERLRSFLQGDPLGGAAVSVGDRVYTRAELEGFIDSRLSEFRDPENVDKVKSSLLESFVEEKMLLHEAEQRGVKPDPEAVKSMMENFGVRSSGEQSPDAERSAELKRTVEDTLSIQKYIQDYLFRDIAVSDRECEEYYDQHLSDFVSRDIIHLHEILVDDQAQAERILASLKENRNRNFGELARLHSKAASAADGGDMGRFQRGDLPEEFERVVFALPPGSVSRIVRTRYGYHMFMVEEKIQAHTQKFYEVREQIHDKLLADRQMERLAKELSRLRAAIPVRIYAENLGFDYVGSKLAPGGDPHP